jgi:hypothetical protein
MPSKSEHVGKTPASRQRQLANLTPGNQTVRHGAHSAAALAPVRKRVLDELLEAFPGVRRDRLELAAAQRARIVLLQAYVDQRGIIRHARHGTTVPAVDLLQREEASYRRELSRIEELAHAADPHAELRAALNAPEDDDDD